eukprot:6825043-Karenia_brevis.AAC.1
MENPEDRAKDPKALTASNPKSSGSAQEEIIDQAVFNSFIPRIFESCEKCPECQKELAMELPPLLDESKCALVDLH